MIVFVEGIVGAGKTTLLEGLERMGARVYREPVDGWTQHLTRLYSRPDVWRLPMQMLALTTRMEVIIAAAEADDTPFKVVERSLRSDHVFATFLTADEQLAYRPVYDAYSRNLRLHEPTRTLYVRCSPETCMRRISQRARPGEDLVTLSYMQALHALHDKAFLGGDVDVLDGEMGEEHVLRQACQLLWGGVVCPSKRKRDSSHA